MCDEAAFTAGPPAGGPAVPRTEFEEIFQRVRAWRRWPADRGAWEGAGARQALEAAALVRAGTVVPLARPWETAPGPDNVKPALHHMTELGDDLPGEPGAYSDFIGVDYHGKSVTHLDALCHISYQGMLFGGRAARETVDSAGARCGSVDRLGALVTRGVLLDLPVVDGSPWLEPGRAVRSGDLLAAEQALGVRLRDGDAALVRTGLLRRRAALGPWDPSEGCAGLHVEALPLLAERGIALLGGDGDSDVRPSPVEGVHSPVHALAITAMGVPLLDDLDLESLSAACAAAGRYEFLLVVAPLRIPGGTGSPVTPVAVL